ncbi:hypothetical protein NUW54_g1770 [Trametes sanguinea]|uniref:Uncharacterized protein n=1 Tax=Trametes sanguinea TaxID=158606 RepID=A0ACC1Q8K1_9APHY|nr:hypothetical protein NUW54_g1770 [Trametes sanguinea]
MFTPVICMDPLRLLLTIAAERDIELAQFDGIGAYLNADLDEEIYMQQPPRYEEGSSPVVRLHKALYRLKQAGCQWNHHINKVLTSDLGFQWLNSKRASAMNSPKALHWMCAETSCLMLAVLPGSRSYTPLHHTTRHVASCDQAESPCMLL